MQPRLAGCDCALHQAEPAVPRTNGPPQQSCGDLHLERSLRMLVRLSKLQFVSSFDSTADLLLLQRILHELCLIRREPVTAPTGKEEHVSVFHEDGCEDCCRLAHRHARSMYGVRTTGSMIEQHRREGTTPRRFPQVTLQMKARAWEFDDLWRPHFSRLSEGQWR